MPEIELGVPFWDPESKVVGVPDKEYVEEEGDDVGYVTAHEIGHWRMGHGPYPNSDKEILKGELEAWAWAAIKRGFTPADWRAYRTEIARYAERTGIGSRGLKKMTLQAIRKAYSHL